MGGFILKMAAGTSMSFHVFYSFSQISDLKARLQLESGALEVQIQSLQSQLTNQKLVLRGEEGLRKKIENDYRKSLDEKRSLLVKYVRTCVCVHVHVHVSTTTTKKYFETNVIIIVICFVLFSSMMSLENNIRDKTREISILQKKISMLESTNKDLMTRLLQVKYSHPCRSRSLTRVEGVLTDLGSV